VNKTINHLRIGSNIFTSSYELENTSEFSINSEDIDAVFVVFPLNNNGLIPPTAADIPQLPSSPENYQLDFKRKNSSPLKYKPTKSTGISGLVLTKQRAIFSLITPAKKTIRLNSYLRLVMYII